MTAIQIKKGTQEIQCGDILRLLTRARANGLSQSDSQYPASFDGVAKELLDDVNSGKLRPKDSLTMALRPLAVDIAFLNVTVLVSDLRPYLAEKGFELTDIPEVAKQARALPVDPVLASLPRQAQVFYTDNIGIANGGGICSVGDFVDSEKDRIKRQDKGYFTVEEAARLLAHSNPGVRVRSMIQHMAKAEVNGTRLVRDFGDQLPIWEGHQLHEYLDLVKVADVNGWLESQGVEYRFPPAMPAKHIKNNSASNDDWKWKAQGRAKEIIAEQRKRDLYPSQTMLGDLIAEEFRKTGSFGPDGKPLKGATIKRHALTGISSAVPKQLSTSNSRGK